MESPRKRIELIGVRFFLIGNDVCSSVRDNIINPEHWAASPWPSAPHTTLYI